ncbi:histone deacetylase family protein, partial [Mesorhizobium sp. M7D.F.Ca.US.004.03.1.1]
MKTVYSPLHAGHAGQMELVTSAIVPGFEKPSRAEFIKARVESEKLGPIVLPLEHDLAAAKRIHKSDYIDFLPTVWPQWVEAGLTGTAMPFTWPTRGLRGDVPPKRVDALLGYYSFDAGATFVEGTWAAIKSSYDVALTAASMVKGGETSAFALC